MFLQDICEKRESAYALTQYAEYADTDGQLWKLLADFKEQSGKKSTYVC